MAIFYANNAKENCPYLFHYVSECESSFEEPSDADSERWIEGVGRANAWVMRK